MPRRDVVVIGGSSGSLEVIKSVLAKLPRNFSASVYVVMHTAPDAPALLADILDRAGPLPAANALQGERPKPGRVYVAPPDHHLLLEPNRIRLSRGPKENRFRPAVDPLFRTAAAVYGPRVIGVIVCGGLDDGRAGLDTVKRLGGISIIQDPREAEIPSMPESAARSVEIDHCVPAREIAPLLVSLTTSDTEAHESRDVPHEVAIENRIARGDEALSAGVLELGTPSFYTCPECHGVLLTMKQAHPLRFRCHTGHAFTLETLLLELDDAIESSIWTLIRTFEEHAMLLRHVARHLGDPEGDTATQLLERAAEADRRLTLARQISLLAEHSSVSSG